MKKIIKMVLFTSAISGLLAWQSAQAITAEAQALLGNTATLQSKPVQGESSGVVANDSKAGEVSKKCDHEAREKQLAKLKVDLKLNLNQEEAWTEWEIKTKIDHQEWKAQHKAFESLANLPALERMEKLLNLTKEHLTEQEARLATTKEFYDLLTTEQRMVFDKDFKFEHHGRFGGHEKK